MPAEGHERQGSGFRSADTSVLTGQIHPSGQVVEPGYRLQDAHGIVRYRQEAEIFLDRRQDPFGSLPVYADMKTLGKEQLIGVCLFSNSTGILFPQNGPGI